MFMVSSYIILTYATYEGPNVSLVKHINYTDNEHFTSVGGLPQILDHPWPRIHRVHQKLRQVLILLFASSGCRVFFNFKITNKILYITGNRNRRLYNIISGVSGCAWWLLASPSLLF